MTESLSTRGRRSSRSSGNGDPTAEVSATAGPPVEVAASASREVDREASASAEGEMPGDDLAGIEESKVQMANSNSGAATEAAGLSKEPGLLEEPELRDRKPMTPFRWTLLNVLLPLASLAVGGIAIWLFGTVEPQKRPLPDSSRVGRMQALEPVRVTPIRTLAETGGSLHLRVDGTVVPFREVQVATELAGQIVFKSEECGAGSYVHQGDLLVRIDPTDYELEVERFTRQLEQAYEAIREVDQEMVNTRRLIEVAEEDVELQAREVRRLEAMPAGFASQGELDRARRGLLQANQQLVGYKNQDQSLEKRRVSLEASERLAATQLRLAKVNLQRTEIRAPIEGVVVREDAEVNSFVARGSPIVMIEDTSKVEVSANLRMDQLYWVMNQAGRPMREVQSGYELPPTDALIEYELSGREGVIYRWQGRLLGYDGIGVDPQTRTVPVRVLVDEPQQYLDADGQEHEFAGPTTLVRGMFVQVMLKLQPQTELYVIPALAMRPGNRVWAFESDESVLDQPSPVSEQISDASFNDEAAEQDLGAEREGLGLQSSLRGFDPAAWIPGRVNVIDSVMPVDSFGAVGDRRGPREMVHRETRNRDLSNRFWICEDRSGRLRSGTMVVVSPLGTLDESGMTARAKLQPATESTGEQTEPAGAPREPAGESSPVAGVSREASL